MTKTVKSSPVQTGVDTRKFKCERVRSSAKKYVCNIYNAGNYVCRVDGKDYLFCEVLTRKAKEAGSDGAKNALYRLFASPATAVLLYGVKAVAVDTANACGYVQIVLHDESGDDTFTEDVD